MKKAVSMIISLLMLISLLAGCGSKCEHKYTSTVTQEATYDSEGVMTYVCEKCGDTYTKKIDKLERHVVPTAVLDEALSNSKLYYNPFSISVGKLVNRAMDGYEIRYLTGEEAIAQGYLSEDKLDDSVDINYVYYAIISGDTMRNIELPYMTTYEEEAVKVWMIFDENDHLQNSGVTVCSNLNVCAIQIATSSY